MSPVLATLAQLLLIFQVMVPFEELIKKKNKKLWAKRWHIPRGAAENPGSRAGADTNPRLKSAELSVFAKYRGSTLSVSWAVADVSKVHFKS